MGVFASYRNRIVTESKNNLSILGNEIFPDDVNKSRLQVDRWRQINQKLTSTIDKIRWFLINSDKGLKEDLTKLYETINDYNSELDELIAIKDILAGEPIYRTNSERKSLYSSMEKMVKRISDLYIKHVLLTEKIKKKLNKLTSLFIFQKSMKDRYFLSINYLKLHCC